MAEVLAKAEKHINGEEALISKKGSSSTHKEKSGTDKRQGQSPKRQRDREGPQRQTENGPRQGEGTSGIAGDHLSLSYSSGIHLSNTPL